MRSDGVTEVRAVAACASRLIHPKRSAALNLGEPLVSTMTVAFIHCAHDCVRPNFGCDLMSLVCLLRLAGCAVLGDKTIVGQCLLPSRAVASRRSALRGGLARAADTARLCGGGAWGLTYRNSPS